MAISRELSERIRWFLLVVGIALLSYTAYAIIDAKVFEAREKRQLDRLFATAMIPAAPSSPASRLQPIPTLPVPGAALGKLEIPRLGISVVVIEGIDGKILRRGVGHIPGTALPGENGNVGIAGHRDTFFRPLRNIQVKDEILFTTVDGVSHYSVDSAEIVETTDTGVLSPSPDSTLTLVTCYPFYFIGPSPKRFIVHARRSAALAPR